MASREYLVVVEESSYGVAATPVLGTNAFVVRLAGSNAFQMVEDPNIQEVMHGGGLATPAFGVSDNFEMKGTLKTELYAGAFSAFLMNWAMTPINTGRTAPWTTTDSGLVMPIGDLASVSMYHGIQLNDGTYDVRQHSGVKAHGGSITTSRQSPIAMISLDLQGVRDNYPATFAAPAETNYLTNPYLFSHSAALVKIGAVVTQYDSLTFSWQNAMDPKWFESNYLVLDKFCGRKTKFELAAYLKASPDRRTAFQGLALQDTVCAFSNGTNSLKMDMGNANLITKLPYELPIDKVFMQNITMGNYYDPAVPGDVVITST